MDAPKISRFTFELYTANVYRGLQGLYGEIGVQECLGYTVQHGVSPVLSMGDKFAVYLISSNSFTFEAARAGICKWRIMGHRRLPYLQLIPL